MVDHSRGMSHTVWVISYGHVVVWVIPYESYHTVWLISYELHAVAFIKFFLSENLKNDYRTFSKKYWLTFWENHFWIASVASINPQKFIRKSFKIYFSNTVEMKEMRFYFTVQMYWGLKILGWCADFSWYIPGRYLVLGQTNCH